jgi:hypothetical protein
VHNFAQGTQTVVTTDKIILGGSAGNVLIELRYIVNVSNWISIGDDIKNFLVKLFFRDTVKGSTRNQGIRTGKSNSGGSGLSSTDNGQPPSQRVTSYLDVFEYSRLLNFLDKDSSFFVE